MLARISSVVGSILFAVWLAREPGWEPLSAFILSALGYVGAEIMQHLKDAKNREHLDVVAQQAERITDLERQNEKLSATLRESERENRGLRETVAPLLARAAREFPGEEINASLNRNDSVAM